MVFCRSVLRASIATPPGSPRKHMRYTLRAASLTDKTVSLNRTSLQLGENDALPALDGLETASGGLTLEPAVLSRSLGERLLAERDQLAPWEPCCMCSSLARLGCGRTWIFTRQQQRQALDRQEMNGHIFEKTVHAIELGR